MAGESKAPSRDIGRSILIAFAHYLSDVQRSEQPRVLAFHELTGATINYIAPIPQTLRLACGDSGFAQLPCPTRHSPAADPHSRRRQPHLYRRYPAADGRGLGPPHSALVRTSSPTLPHSNQLHPRRHPSRSPRCSFLPPPASGQPRPSRSSTMPPISSTASLIWPCSPFP